MEAGRVDRAESADDGWTMTVVTIGAESVDVAAEVLRTAGASAVEERAVSADPDGAVELWTCAISDPSLSRRLVEACGSSVAVRTERVARSVAETWRDHARPVRVGSLVIAPSWWVAGSEEGETVVRVDPEHLFGLGDHPTTRGALEMLLTDDHLTRTGTSGEQWRLVDAGCGSGILGIAVAVEARRRGATVPLIRGFDVAPGTADVVARNSRRNDVHTYDVTDPDEIPGGWAHTTVANILAPALRDLAPVLSRVTMASGRMLLAGMRGDQWQGVVAAYPEWRVTRHAVDEGWHTIGLARSRPA